MAYTNTWDETAPLGTADADTIDDIIRQLKVDIRERMNTLLDATGQWDDDPVVLAGQKRTGLKLLIPGTAAQPISDDDDISRADGYFQSDNSATNTSQLPLPLRSDWKITKVEVLFDLSTDTSVTIALKKTTFTDAATTSEVDSVTVSATGINVQTVFSGAETVSDNYLWLKFTGSDAGRYKVYAVQVTYDEV